MVRNAQLGTRVNIDTKNKLETAAKNERRSLNDLVNVIIEDWLRENGYSVEPSSTENKHLNLNLFR